jgi:hypothetical protein
VVATCPAPAKAELTSWEPVKPYQLRSVAPGPAETAAATFRHGNRRVVMEVTCNKSVPALKTTSP